MNTKPRITVIGTGGTIQNTESGRLSLIEFLRGITDRHGQDWAQGQAEITTIELLSAGGEYLGSPEWQLIAEAVQKEVDRDEVDGVVVTHGTFTAEETAFVLQLTVDTAKPVVIAVAQRKHGTVGNDGDRNLLDALRVASSDAAVGAGVLLVVSDEIHSARDVVKEHRRLSGFQSISGPVGTVESDQVSFYRHQARCHTSGSTLRRTPLSPLPRVDIVAAYPDADAVAIEAFTCAGAQGIVVAGYAYSGVGSPAQMTALEELAGKGMAVVLSSRGRDGRIPSSDRWSIVRADNLPPQKARIMLAIGLTQTRSRERLQLLFDTH